MPEHHTPEGALRSFAEETDASADLGRDPDAATRLKMIHAIHDAALTRLRAENTRLGHVRVDIDETGAIRFLNEAPWVIAFVEDDRQILRILHGARDLPTLLPTRPG